MNDLGFLLDSLVSVQQATQKQKFVPEVAQPRPFIRRLDAPPILGKRRMLILAETGGEPGEEADTDAALGVLGSFWRWHLLTFHSPEPSVEGRRL